MKVFLRYRRWAISASVGGTSFCNMGRQAETRSEKTARLGVKSSPSWRLFWTLHRRNASEVPFTASARFTDTTPPGLGPSSMRLSGPTTTCSRQFFSSRQGVKREWDDARPGLVGGRERDIHAGKSSGVGNASGIGTRGKRDTFQFDRGGRRGRVNRSSGASVDARDRYGLTAYLHAALQGDVAAGRELLRLGADPGLLSDKGESAADIAAARGHQWHVVP